MYGGETSIVPSLVEGVFQVRVLVVDDDSTCLILVAGFLKSFGYEVATARDPLEALSTLHNNHQSFDIILTDVHMPNMNGMELQKLVQQDFEIPVICDDNRSTAVQALQNGAVYFILKPPSLIELKNIWKYVVTSKKGQKISPTLERAITSNAMLDGNSRDDHNTISSSINEERVCPSFHKRRVEDAEDRVEYKVVKSNPKKTKLVWTTPLHNKFLGALHAIGLDKAVPKKILEFMKVPELTRENVASHLQKYRIYLRKLAENGSSIRGGMPENWNERPFRSTFSWSQFPSLINNSFLLKYVNSSNQKALLAPANYFADQQQKALISSGTEGLNLLNEQPRNNYSVQQPTIDANTVYNNSTYFGGNINILESSLLGGQNNVNTTPASTGIDEVRQDLAKMGELGTAAMQFLSSKPANSNLDHQFGMNFQVGSLMNVASHDQNQTTMTQKGTFEVGEPSSYQPGSYMALLQGDPITNSPSWNDLPPPEDSFWDLPLPGENQGGSSFNDNAARARENNLNGNIQDQGNQFPGFPVTPSNDPIAVNQSVEQAAGAVNISNLDNGDVNMTNLNNNNIPAPQQEAPAANNNPHDIFQLTPPQERSNFDGLLCGSPFDFHYQEWLQNLDAYTVDDLNAFLSSHEAGNGSNNNNQQP